MNDDRALAKQVLDTLRRLQGSMPHRSRLLDDLRLLARNAANPTPDHERADAWLAICHLYEAIERNYPNASNLWEEAIKRTDIWYSRLV